MATLIDVHAMDSIPECSDCGADATTELADASGVLWPLCAACDVWWRESVKAPLGVCQDCCVESATRQFVHLQKGVFCLCERCFVWADHEEDYLDYCNHAAPEGRLGQVYCDLCHRPFREPDTEEIDDEYDFIDPGEQDDDFLAEESESEDEDEGEQDDNWGMSD